MNSYLKSTFRKEEIELAASIGAQTKPLESRIEMLFRQLGDPLLSATDVEELLASGLPTEDLVEALHSLEESDVLESSKTTLRPKDPEGVQLFRLKGLPVSRLQLVASETALHDGQSRYQFTCEGRLIRAIAKVDRLDALGETGQQREEIAKHVDQIAKGIQSGTQVPNSILLVLRDSETKDDAGDGSDPQSFILVRPIQEWVTVMVPSSETAVAQKTRLVQLDFPFRAAAFDEEKAALLVDGQQRTAGLSFVDIDVVPSFFFSVNALVASDEEAKGVFQVANSTVKISTQFSRALTASMGEAPGYLRQEQRIAQAVKSLALTDNKSPFKGLVQYPGTKTTPKPPVAYNSLFQVVASFETSALSFDDAKILSGAVARGFDIVKATWPNAWGKKPDKSRLMHGVGLRSVAALLIAKLENAVASEHYNGDLLADEVWTPIEKSIDRLKDVIVWTEEDAATASKSAQKKWREETASRQNTSQDIAAFTSFLRKESLHQDVEAQNKIKKAKK